MAAEDDQADPAGLRRSGTDLREVRTDHRVQPRRVRRVAVPRIPRPARPGAARRHRRGAQAARRGTRRRAVRPVRHLRGGAVRFGVHRPGALRDPAHRRGGRRQDPAAGHPPPRRRRPADPAALRPGRRTGQAGPSTLGAGRRRRLLRQPGRGAGLPPRGTVDGRVDRPSAAVAAGQEHPGAAGVLGFHQRAGADDGAHTGRPDRRRLRHPQGRLRRHRTGQGAAVLGVRGRAAPRAVPRRPARGQPVRRRRGPHRVLRLRHHGPDRPADPLAAA